MGIRSVVKSSVVRLLAEKYVDDLARYFTPFIVPVFMLHRFTDTRNNIAGHDPEFVDHSLRLLRERGYSFLDLDEAVHLFLENKLSHHKVVCFTLDDGFDDQINMAADIFQKHQCASTCFLITDFLDGHSWPWDSKLLYLIDQLDRDILSFSLWGESFQYAVDTPGDRSRAATKVRELVKGRGVEDVEALTNLIIEQTGVIIPEAPPTPFQPISWDRVRELESRGMRFGAHTRSHRILSRLSDEESESEILHSRMRLAQETRVPSDVFCYPVGRATDFSMREMETAKRAGCLAAVSAEPGYMTKSAADTSRFAIPRFGMPDTVEDLLQYCSWIEYAKGRLFA